MSEPAIASVLSLGGASESEETWSTIVPYRNPPALVGYYISIISLLPPLGVLGGPAAIVLGVIGLKKRNADPRCKGTAHAWVAISLGLIGTLISGSCLGVMIIPNL